MRHEAPPALAGALLGVAVLAAALLAPPVQAQERVPIDIEPVEGAPEDSDEEAQAPDAVDVLAARAARVGPSPAAARECEEAIEAGEISGEIVVCRQLSTSDSNRFSESYAQWLKDYAERTKFHNAPPPPNVDGSGLPYGLTPVIEIKGCFIPPCPAPPAVLIDVEALPPPPVGSDAYWQAKGINPRGSDGKLTPQAQRILQEAELGLPPVPDFSEDED
ncbi:MAG: hypothetical protein QNI87_13520 [Erythrobacter sp.]|uniref:hypothetical protein n=1 Tax=Erythrobacter sp. TaxID=1042 RepID=UPI002614FB3E|nr:hypothetical protein [Erythrobacter sp.]MDJ0979541.1 hypothetical protein [Erythrobacter sp.]